MSEPCRETNSKKTVKQKQPNPVYRLLCVNNCFFAGSQVTEATAAGLETCYPVGAQRPGGQVLRDGSFNGNSEETQHVFAGHAHTGELTVTARHS